MGVFRALLGDIEPSKLEDGLDSSEDDASIGSSISGFKNSSIETNDDSPRGFYEEVEGFEVPDAAIDRIGVLSDGDVLNSMMEGLTKLKGSRQKML